MRGFAVGMALLAAVVFLGLLVLQAVQVGMARRTTTAPAPAKP